MKNLLPLLLCVFIPCIIHPEMGERTWNKVVYILGLYKDPSYHIDNCPICYMEGDNNDIQMRKMQPDMGWR